MPSPFAECATRRLALALLAAALFAPSPAGAAEVPARAKAEAALMAAEIVARAGDPAKVEPLVQKAFEVAPDDASIWKRGARILAGAETLRRQQTLAKERTLLAEAQRLADDGNVKDAREILRGKLDSLDPDLLSIADHTLAATHHGWLVDRFLTRWRDSWLFDALLGLLFIALVAAVLWLVRRGLARKYRASWLIAAVDDATGAGVAMMASERLTRWSEEPVTGSAGLLRMDSLSVQFAPRFERQLEIVLSAALAELPNFGQVSLGALAKAFEALRSQAMRLRPAINISASTLDQQIIVQLTRKARDGKIRLTASAGPKTVEGAGAAAASASFKMYYLLANDTSLAQAEAADKLRIGLEHLRRYAGGRDPAALKLANETISAVLAEIPGFDEARLYLGVVLDLQERHDEAEGAFRFLRDHGEADVRLRATYNLAVSNFRKYKPDALREAIAILDELVGTRVADDLAPGPAWFARLAQSPIRAMAVAARANAVAHKPIWWQTFLFGDTLKEPLRRVIRRKRAARERILEWVHRIDRIADALRTLGEHDLDEQYGWDALTKRQLLWSTHNARGNVRLNLAIHFWREPAVSG